MKVLKFSGITFLVLSALCAYAQIPSSNGAVLYGNEWIQYDQTYYRIPVGEDGWKKITRSQLLEAGITNPRGADIRLHHNGVEVPIYLTSESALSDNDYVLFYGEKNRSEQEEYLFEKPSEQMLNPEYSLFTDTSVYFLSVQTQGAGMRYQARDLNNGVEQTYLERNEVYAYSNTHYTEAFSGVFDPDFRDLEGFARPFTKDHVNTISIPYEEMTGDSVTLILGTGAGIRTRKYDLYIQDKFIKKINKINFQRVSTDTVTLALSELSKNLKVRLLSELSTERAGLAYVKLIFQTKVADYSRLNSETFQLSGNENLQDLVFDLTKTGEVLLDKSSGLVYQGRVANAKVTFTVENNNEAEFGFPNQAVEISSMKSIQFENYLENDFDYLIITHKLLEQEVNGVNAVAKYADYRSSAAGGGYRVLTVDINQLRDQFIYGIEGHPFSIRNFIQKINSLNKPLRFVNIIGKGLTYSSVRSAANYAKNKGKIHYIPTFGFYGSDNLLVSNPFDPVPLYAVGRIPITESNELLVYLEKVKTYESVQSDYENVEDRKWLKKVLHFNGGDRSIYASIARTMDGVGDRIAQDSFAANVVSYYKSSFGTDESPKQEEIYDQINSGAALISFLGHSASTALDFDIDNIGEYQNKGRLPIFVALGCSSGNIFLETKNLSELFVLTEDFGSIAFLSTASSEYLHTLQIFANYFYEEFGGKKYGQPLGEILMAAHGSMGAANHHLVSVFTFCGDPALQPYHADGPDFTANEKSITLLPERPSLLDEKVELSIFIDNLGISYPDSISMMVKLQVPTGELITLDTIRFLSTAYSTEVKIDIPMLDNMEGRNLLFLTIDPDQDISEFPSVAGEQNNQLYVENKLGYEFYVRNSSIQLSSPYNKAIVPVSKPALVFFNGNVGTTEINYEIEIDSLPNYGSPFKKVIQKSSSLSQVEVMSPVDLESDKVYYWRVRGVSDSVYSASHSFVYVDQQTGWNQSHFGQFWQDSVYQILADETNIRFATIKNELDLSHGPIKANTTFNAEVGRSLSRMTNASINVSIWKPYKNDFVGNPHPGLYNSFHPLSGDGILKTFCFEVTQQEQRQSLLELVTTESEPGDVVLIWNSTEGDSPQGDTWAQDSISQQGVNLFNFFESKGSQQIRELATDDKLTYTFMYREGGEVLYENLLAANTVFHEVLIFESAYEEGSVHTSEVDFLENISRIALQNESNPGSDDVQYTGTFTTQNGEIKQGHWNNSIDLLTTEYPEITSFRLDAEFSDLENRSLPKIDYWRIFGDYKVDLRISNVVGKAFVDVDALKRRELAVRYQIYGMERVQSDSVGVQFEIIAQNYSWNRIQKFATKDLTSAIYFMENIPSEIRADFIFKITVDPSNDIDEAVETNNSILTVVPIKQDNLAPKLDVTFDNSYILNGDIISPNSHIVVEILEIGENNLSQPLDFDFHIVYPDGQKKIILENDAQLTIDYRDDRILLEYESAFVDDGTYTLQVRAKDNYQNAAEVDYQIQFEVINESQISSFLPYPNPFINSMRFAYTLTGSEEPEYFSILIYSPSGRLVKEISKQEFGPMNIGNHLSTYVWDGTDNYNQNLAPGVYLYKVIARDKERAEYKKYQISELDNSGYFKNNIGKIVKLK